jgi:hypothetical protein
MIFGLFSLAITTAFFMSSLALLNYGRHRGLLYLRKAGVNSVAGLTTVESAVFALIGLLLAFTVSGALQRFDERRQLVVQEANALSTAYDRVGLLDEDAAEGLRSRLRDYARARIAVYGASHDLSLLRGAEVGPREQQQKVADAKDRLWAAALAACSGASFRPACGLVIPPLQNVFEVARLRLAAGERHPPQIIYLMLFGLGLAGSVLAGFGMAVSPERSWMHMVAFAATLAVTLYVVTDMEFPRLGLIHIEAFDHFVTDAHDLMR